MTLINTVSGELELSHHFLFFVLQLGDTKRHNVNNTRQKMFVPIDPTKRDETYFLSPSFYVRHEDNLRVYDRKKEKLLFYPYLREI